MTNKDKVVALQRSIETRDHGPLAYIHPERYRQHNLHVADGLAPILALHETLPRDTTRATPVRAIQDGDFVAVHVEYDLWGPKAGFDVHRFEGGRIVEHWDNLQPMPDAPNPGGHTMTDGAREVTDLGRTVENKALIATFMRELVIGRSAADPTRYFAGPRLVQHNPTLDDQVGSYLRYLGAAAPSAPAARYDTLHLLLGEGNFVLAASGGTLDGAAAAFYDLFRVEGGAIREHWDVVEAIPPREHWQHGNGKF